MKKKLKNCRKLHQLIIKTIQQQIIIMQHHSLRFMEKFLRDGLKILKKL